MVAHARKLKKAFRVCETRASLWVVVEAWIQCIRCGECFTIDVDQYRKREPVKCRQCGAYGRWWREEGD